VRSKLKELEISEKIKVDKADELCGIGWLRSKVYQTVLNSDAKRYTLVDLFCGCGGLSLGVREALRVNGFALDIMLAVDNNSYALEVYKRNFGVSDKTLLNIDISTLLPSDVGKPLCESEKDINERFTGVDIVVAGPPCQGYSNLNNHTRGKDPKNKLYLKVIRFAEITQPKAIIIENVATIIYDKNNVVSQAEELLEEMGYTVMQFVIEADKLGIPQTRKRHILVAVRQQKIEIGDVFSYNLEKVSILSDFIYDLVDECEISKGIFYTPSAMSNDNKRRVSYLFDNDLYDLPNSERPSCHRNKKHKYVAVYGRLHWNKPAPTITGGFGSMGQGRFIHPLKPRVITAHEAARIQGFPDFFDFTSVPYRNTLYEIIGNAVPPKISALAINALVRLNYL
jgi:DNA (cytosine-5)-methyltransferase 1